jgi:hypothetical protein
MAQFTIWRSIWASLRHNLFLTFFHDMRSLLSGLITLLFSLSACAQTVGQWELRKRGSTGMTSYGITAENGKAIGFTNGVPTMLAVGSIGAGAGDALIGDPLSQFAATTSAQLRGVLSDESGTGLFLTTTGSGASLTGITAGQITGLGTLATQSATITDYLTSATAASTYQPLDSDLTSIAALTTTTAGRALLDDANAAAQRTTLGLGTLATQNGTFSGSSSGTNTGDQDLSAYLTTGNGVTISGSIIYGIINGRDAGPVQAADGQIIFAGGANHAPFTGGTAGQLQMQGADAVESLANGGNGGSLIMYGTANQNAGSISTIAGGSLTMGTADLAGGGVAGTILTTAGNGSGLTNLNADNITSGTVAAARLGSGTSIATKFLRGDNTFQTISGGGDALTSGTLAQFAATTSALLRGVLSDESGTGLILTTTGSGASLTGITAGQITGLGTLATQSATITDYLTTATAASTYQPLDSDLTSLAALVTTTAGRALLDDADAAAQRTTLGLGTLATQSATITDYLLSATAASTYQPLDSDLTSLAALVTTTAGRALLDDADAAAQRTTLGLGTLATQSATITDYLLSATASSTYQPLDADLTDLADGSLTGTTVAAATTSARGSVELATDGETAASVAVQGSDTRLVNGTKVEIGIALSDETSDNTASSTTPKVTFRMPFAMTITSLRCSLTKASTGAILIVDLHESGTTVMTTNKLSVDASETTSTTAATAHTLTDTALADDALIELFIDQVGTTTDNTGEGVKVWIIGTR